MKPSICTDMKPPITQNHPSIKPAVFKWKQKNRETVGMAIFNWISALFLWIKLFSSNINEFSLQLKLNKKHFIVYCNLSCDSNTICAKHNDEFIIAKIVHWRMPQRSPSIWLHWFGHFVLIETHDVFFIMKSFDYIFNIFNTPVRFVFSHWNNNIGQLVYQLIIFLMKSIDNDTSHSLQIHYTLTSICIEHFSHFCTDWAISFSIK